MSTEVAPRHEDRVIPVVSALEAHGLIDPARHQEAVEVVAEALGVAEVEATPLRRRLAELAGYLGGAFVVAAGALFVAEQWTDLTVAAQVLLLFGIAVLLFVAGAAVAVTGGGFAALLDAEQSVRRRLASVLFTGGSAAAAAAVIVWLIDVVEQRGNEVDDQWLIGFGGSLTLLVLATVGYRLAHSLLGQLAVAVGAAYAIPFVLEGFDLVDAPVVVGLAFLGLGLGWLVLVERGVWHEVVPGQILGAALVVVGAQIPVASDDAWVGYLVTILVAMAGFTVYVVRRAWPYLAVGVVGVTLAVPEALLDWTEGSLGTAGVLLVAGVTLLGASLLGLRLRKEVEHPS